MDSPAVRAQSAGSGEIETGPSPGAPELNDVSARALGIYEERLQALLETDHIGRVVAIHPESGDFAVGGNSPGARRALRERRQEGMIVTMRIGPERAEPTLDRMLGERP